jgi:hypothetical protein
MIAWQLSLTLLPRDHGDDDGYGLVAIVFDAKGELRMRKLMMLVVAGAVALAACGMGDEAAEDISTSSSVTSTQVETTTTTTVAQATTTVVRTTTPAFETTTTVARTTATVDPSTECPDCPEGASEDDRSYVASMRLVESWYDSNFVTSMSAFEVMEIGRTVCVGLAGSFNGSLDVALIVVTGLHEVEPGSGTGVAVAAIEQAVRVDCPKFTDDWIEWAGAEPYDPFE